MRFAGRKKTKQLTNKLLKRIGASHRYDRLIHNNIFELKDISGFTFEEFTYSAFGYTVYVNSEEVVDTLSRRQLDEQTGAVIERMLYALRYKERR